MRLLLATHIAVMAVLAQVPDEGRAIFQKQVAPVLNSQCGGCHLKQKISGFGIGSREDLLKGGARGPAIRPGSPGDSLLMSALDHSGQVKMPPGSKLPDVTRAAFRRWIELGAPWADGRAEPQATAEAGDDTWAFRPVKKPLVPAGSANPVDAFIDKKLRERSLSAAPKADRRTLIRRATFDLWGLPPSPEDVEAFANDPSPDAWPKLVDRLLASRRRLFQ